MIRSNARDRAPLRHPLLKPNMHAPLRHAALAPDSNVENGSCGNGCSTTDLGPEVARIAREIRNALGRDRRIIQDVAELLQMFFVGLGGDQKSIADL